VPIASPVLDTLTPALDTPKMNALRARAVTRNTLKRELLDKKSLVMTYIISNDDADRDAHENGRGSLPILHVSRIREQAKELRLLGLRAVKLFIRGRLRDATASEASNPNGLSIRAIKAFKDADPDLCIHTETCLCPYTETGTCVVFDRRTGEIDPISFERFGDLAIAQARAGADVLGPAGMAPGTIAATSRALIREGFGDVALMPHLIFTSAFYGPYWVATCGREADRRNLQLDPSRPEQAIPQAQSFIAEGADMILIEPALSTIDVVSELHRAVACPIGSFSVSGEFECLCNSHQDSIAISRLKETFAAMRRAGSDLIVTYAAKMLARAIN
jgi:porphobilinogen synthase